MKKYLSIFFIFFLFLVSISGYCNNVTRSNFIGGGDFNIISNNITGGGCNNSLLYNFIGGGALNCVNPGANLSSIVGGIQNCIGGTPNINHANYGFIGGGQQNCIDSNTTASAYFGVIGGGFCNLVCAGTRHTGIFSGLCNTNAGYYSAILGGACNTISNAYQYAGIFGCNITAKSSCAFHTNCILVPDMPSAIGGLGTFAHGTLYYDPITKAVYWNL